MMGGFSRLRVLGAAAMLAMTFGATAARADDWPQWRGPNRDGISTEKGFLTTFPADGPKIAWKAALGKGYSTFAVSDGKAVTQGKDGGKDVIYCFDVDSGKEVWKYGIDKAGDEPAATPAIEGGKVYAMARRGVFVCLGLADGKVVWSKEVEKEYGARKPQYGFCTSPLLTEKGVFVDVGPNVTVDKGTGAAVWKEGSGEPSYGSPVPFKAGSTPLLALFKASGLLVIDGTDGKSVASYGWTTAYNVNAATPIVTSSGIFISSGYGHGCSLISLDSGKTMKVYENKEMQNQYTSSVCYKGHLYGLSDGKKLVCMDVATGKTVWKKDGLGAGGLMIADGKLIIMADGGTLAIAEADPTAYKELASAKILSGQCWTSPVLSGGRIFCRNTDGAAVCVDVRGK